jgi:signal recognition particle receptor subunit beta
MASVNPHTRELVFKLVFYGPGLGGKTTTLQYIHAATKAEHKGKMVSLATPTDRTLYFDFLPVRVPRVNGMSIRLQLFTVPGQVYYEATRKLVLSGADGVVFVADSQASRIDTNQESLEDLEASLAEHGRMLDTMPHTFHWNKRDLSDLVPTEELDRRYNKHHAPSIGTVALRGDGVFEGLERITGLVLAEYGKEKPDAILASVRDAFKSIVDAHPSTESEDLAPITVGRPAVEPPPPAASPSVPSTSSAASASSAAPEPRRQTVALPSSPAGAALVQEPAAPAPSPLPPTTAEIMQPRASALPDRTVSSVPARRDSQARSGSPQPPEGEPKIFSFTELFVEAEREGARKIELFLGVADPHGAILASDSLLTRVLASAAMAAGAQDAPRDPAIVSNLLGCDGRNYLQFRSVVRAARARETVTMRDAFECYLFVLDARKRRDDVRRPR